ncbi:sulfatase family protein [Rhizosphaericola mali]|uniref:Sulfatase n=1 Tax=Rhizosphaericola mali TaxID=2545455 RepID=A0A5P2G4W0_9BACT|nr:sulfatase [Rhizosphaericola mali]QES88123.1 sulfatase [Rhizosphaericola mali]
MKYIIFFVLSSVISFKIFGQTKRPNIILILSDDHSYPFLGIYGNNDVHTTHIDSLAKNGIRYTNTFVSSPQCTPSRATLFTGRNPLDIRMTRFAATLPKEIITYPELLRKSGYYTGIFGRNYHMDGSGTTKETDSIFNKYQLRTFKNRVDHLRIGGNNTAYPQLKEFLNQRPKEKPFFCQISYNDPHYPWDQTSFTPNADSINYPNYLPNIKEGRNFLARHYGEIGRMDSLVGLVLGELKKRNLEKNTLIIFMGDNGSAILRGKGTLYDMGLHVPLIISWYGKIEPSIQSDILISGEDIAPTILDIAGVKIPKEITGKSIKNTWSKDSAEIHSYIFAERGAHGTKLPNSTFDYDESRTVFNKYYKLIYNALWQLPYTPVDFDNSPLWNELIAENRHNELTPTFQKLLFTTPRPMFEFYDLKKDPHEFNNLIQDPKYKNEIDIFKYQLQEWMILNQDFLPLPIPAGKYSK